VVKLIIQPQQFHPQDAIQLTGCTPEQAAFNQATGPAYSFFDGDELLACGGARTYGVGEAWLMVSEKVRGEMKKTLIETTAHVIDKIVREQSLWRLWANTDRSENFLRHIGFKKVDAFKWEAK